MTQTPPPFEAIQDNYEALKGIVSTEARVPKRDHWWSRTYWAHSSEESAYYMGYVRGRVEMIEQIYGVKNED